MAALLRKNDDEGRKKRKKSVGPWGSDDRGWVCLNCCEEEEEEVGEMVAE